MWLLSAETWALLLALLLLFVLNGYSTYGLFRRLRVPGPSPRVYLGSVARHHKVYYLDDVACRKKYGKVWGVYELRRPLLMVTDVDMIRTVLVKECFRCFTNRRNLRLNGDLADALSLMEDERWRRTRHTVSPFFSSGRLKEMFRVVKHHSGKATQFLRSRAEKQEALEVKRFFGAYVLDAIVSLTCSVDVDSLNHPASPLVEHASGFLRVWGGLFMLQGLFPSLLPLLEKLDLSLFPRSSSQFFLRFLRKVQEERRGAAQVSPDFLSFMADSQASGGPAAGLSEREVLIQAAMLVLGGYSTGADTLTFVAYNLARHPEVMTRLQQEIDATFPGESAVEYQALMQMEYLDCVVSESLRLYPPAARLERVAKQTVVVGSVEIPKGLIVAVPVFALHRDPDLWPDPEDFKPERFSRERRVDVVPYSYLPFGAGPRNCVGMRLALIMVKLVLVEVLQNFSFSVCAETEIPLEMDPQGLVGPLRPIKLRVEPRA
ncbi:cytochrome P450 3A40-like [Synchiropus splendidus]|uniref:cytochrome P450 3A40-like n=1 Tax=Synchiropus splendidus TaxID=270530 RepID=UPI00237D6437|nr:cytochrome P450 3A40-like [Synchiropus splendidus]